MAARRMGTLPFGKIGFFLGKFVYLMMPEDVEKDIASGSYNPLKEAFANDSDFAGNCRGLLTLYDGRVFQEFREARPFCMRRSCETSYIPASGAAIRQLPPSGRNPAKAQILAAMTQRI